MQKTDLQIPETVSHVTETLENAGFEAYLVGGCVRDLLIGKTPKDWDITTNARPEQIQECYEETFYENEYGTVGVVTESDDPSLKVIEITPYRIEGEYSDARRPDEVTFADNLEDDLKRRDFTVNAIALKVSDNSLEDPFEGRQDIERKLIRAVGEPKDRFAEDGLRILRGVRLSAELGFALDGDTATAMHEQADVLAHISKERIRDEFIRILESDQPMEALILAHRLGVLTHVAPDIERGIGVEQNQAHSFDVFEHNLRSMQHAADKKWSVDLRLAGLFHDISKPETRRWSKEKGDWTFYGHDVVGARVTKRVLNDLKFPKQTVKKIETLVRWHMFFSDPDVVTLSAVRRMIRNVGGEQEMWDLLNLRVCDRIGTGRPKEQPFRLRKYISMVEEALRDPISVGMLKIDGDMLISELHMKPGPRIGHVLHALLEEVLDAPEKNTKEYLQNRAQELNKLADTELAELGKAGKARREAADEAEITQLREKYNVR